jgi:hypothetical protein
LTFRFQAWGQKSRDNQLDWNIKIHMANPDKSLAYRKPLELTKPHSKLKDTKTIFYNKLALKHFKKF